MCGKPSVYLWNESGKCLFIFFFKLNDKEILKGLKISKQTNKKNKYKRVS